MTEPEREWTASDQAETALGDNGPWVRHLALAWHAVNVPAGLNVPLPVDPTDQFVRSAPRTEDRAELHEDLCAYWGPLTHLLCFGLGWTRPDLGLARWLDLGAPTEDPVLRLVDRWWGRERVTDFLAWACTTPGLVQFGSRIAETGGYRRFDDTRLPDRHHERRQTHSWHAVWGDGGDPLHLLTHSTSPMTYPPEGPAAGFAPVPHWGDFHTVTDPATVPRMVIVNHTYRAWHALLWHYRPAQGGNGRSVRTDVVITPVGWMGEYRHSATTGAWFRGRHRWHLLGS